MKYLDSNNNNNNNNNNSSEGIAQPQPGGHSHSHSHGMHKYASTGGILPTKPIPWSSKGEGKGNLSSGNGGDGSGNSGYSSRPGTSSSGVGDDTTAYPYTDNEDFETAYDGGGGSGDGVLSKNGPSNRNHTNNGSMTRPTTGSSMGNTTRPNTSGYMSGSTSATPMLHNNGVGGRAGPGAGVYEGGYDEYGATKQQQQQQQQQQQGMMVKTMRYDPPSQPSYPQQQHQQHQQQQQPRTGSNSGRGSGSGSTTPSRRRRQPTQLMTIDADEIPGNNTPSSCPRTHPLHQQSLTLSLTLTHTYDPPLKSLIPPLSTLYVDPSLLIQYLPTLTPSPVLQVSTKLALHHF